MRKLTKKPKITLERLARMTQDEFVAVHKEMQSEFVSVRSEMRGEFVAVREGMRELQDNIVDEVRNENLKVLQSNDKVITKLDTLLMDQAAHSALHKRTDDTLYSHHGRIKKLEEVVHVSPPDSSRKG